MEGMASGSGHDEYAPHGAFLGHVVPVRRMAASTLLAAQCLNDRLHICKCLSFCGFL